MEFVINEATYSLPCRSFVIDYAVSQKRKLAVVKEFTIRLLYALKDVSSDKIADYFGFSIEEMQVVLASLQEESLIKWDDGNVTLTSYAHDRFKEVNGKAEPRFFEVQDQIDTVTFDLLTFKLIAERASGDISPNNMEIPLPESAMGNLVEKARSAFDLHFNTFLEKAKNIDTYSDATELYKINQIHNRMDRLLPVRVQYVITADTAQKPTIRYADEWMNEWDEDKSLYAAICSQSESPSFVQANINSAIEEYLDVTKDPIILDFLREDKFDFSSALAAYEANKGVFSLDTRMIVGNLYSDTNQKLLHDLLDYKFGEDTKLSAKGIIWSVDLADKIWGRCPELGTFISSLEERLDERRKPLKTVLTTKVTTHNEAFQIRDRYGITKCRFQGVNKSIGNGQVEILLIPGVIAACIFHFTIEHHYPLTLPIGFISTDEQKVSQIESALKAVFENNALTNNYFERRGSDSEGMLLKSIVEKVFNNS